MAYVFGILSAFFYGLASVMQHKEASAAPASQSMRLGLLANLLKRPLWTAGIGADAVAFVFQALALSRGPLVLVQPLLTLGLFFALALSAVLERRRIAGREWLASAALAAGLTLLLSVEGPAEGRLVVPFHRWIVGGFLVAATCLVLIYLARRVGHRLKPGLLGIAAAITFAMTNTMLKSAVDVLGHRGLVEVIDGWYLYALIGLGLVGMLLVTSAFQAGPLELSLPILTVVEPIASSALGVLLFAEAVRSDPHALIVEFVAGCLVVFGIWVLGHSPTVTGSASKHAAGTPAAESLPSRNPGETAP